MNQQQDQIPFVPGHTKRQGCVREDYAHQFVQIAREGFWMFDRQWRTVMVNPRLCELLGYSRESMLGRHVIDFYFPEDHEKVMANLAGREHGAEGRYVVRYRRLDGTELWAEISVKPMFSDKGQFDGAIAVLVDIGERLAAERELRATRDLIETSADVLQLGFWDADIEARQMSWTRHLEILFGFLPGTYNGSFESFYDRIHPEDRGQVMVAYEKSIETGETYTFDYRVRTVDGGWRWIGARGRVIAGADGRATRSVGVAVCIDEYKRLEGQLLQSQRLESLGHLVSSIAHDFNNFLDSICLYSELAKGSLDPSSEAAQYLRIVEDSGSKAAELVRRMLTFASHRISAPQCTDISVLTTSLKGLLSGMVGEGVDLIMSGEERELYVRIDPVQYEQIIVNLVVNASQAMPDGGKLIVSTGVRWCNKTEEELIVITVEDSGVGMDTSTMTRIFDPFFTTKETGKGTGLGLSTCFGIVKSADGQITVCSEIGVGSKFEILFPRASPAILRECA